MSVRWTLGEVVDWNGARPPGRAPLVGSTVRLEPIDPTSHGPPLFFASHGPGCDPHLWDYMSVGPFPDEEQFAAWLAKTAESADPLFFAVVDLERDLPGGMASYLRITPNHGVIEIGHIWFGKELQKTRQATEAIFLLTRHVFDDLGYRRLEWKCDALNDRSRGAAERFGFSYEGIFRQHMVVKGRNRDTAWYAMLDRDWPVVRAAFERWLDPENFDDEGHQVQTLSAVRASLL